MEQRNGETKGAARRKRYSQMDKACVRTDSYRTAPPEALIDNATAALADDLRMASEQTIVEREMSCYKNNTQTRGAKVTLRAEKGEEDNIWKTTFGRRTSAKVSSFAGISHMKRFGGVSTGAS
jgi:hypothetical protein